MTSWISIAWRIARRTRGGVSCALLVLAGHFLLPLFAVNAQVEPIETDRPDQTETPAVVPAGMLQIESGFTYAADNRSDNLYIPSVEFRYGLSERLELHLGVEPFLPKPFEAGARLALNPVFIGMKIQLAEEKGILPKISMNFHLLLPKVASREFAVDHVAPLFRFLCQHTLSARASLGYNLGMEWDGNSAEPVYIYTIVLDHELTSVWKLFAELYGFVPEKRPVRDHRLCAGVICNPLRNLQFDLSGGLGYATDVRDAFFLSFGFSIRIPE